MQKLFPSLTGIVHFSLIVVITLLSSCTTTRRTTQTKTEADQTTTIQAEATNTSVTTETVTDTAKETLTIPADTNTVNFDNDTTDQTYDLPSEIITIHHNKLTTIIKPRTIPVDINRTTVSQATVTAKAELHEAVVSHSDSAFTDTTKTSGWFKQIDPNWLWLLLLIVPVYVWWKNKHGVKGSG